MCRVHIGGEEREFVEIIFLGRQFDDAEDYWDGNSLTATVIGRAGAFLAEQTGTLRADEVSLFAEHVREVYTSLEGWAELATLEGWLTLRVQMHRRGNAWVDGDLIDDPHDGNRLRFHFNLDQSYLPRLLADLQRTTERFPVRGMPPPEFGGENQL